MNSFVFVKFFVRHLWFFYISSAFANFFLFDLEILIWKLVLIWISFIAHWFDLLFKFFEIMAKDDYHIVSLNLSSKIGSNIRVYTLFPNDYEVCVCHMEDYITSIEKHGSYIWKSITKGPHLFLRRRNMFTPLQIMKNLLISIMTWPMNRNRNFKMTWRQKENFVSLLLQKHSNK